MPSTMDAFKVVVMDMVTGKAIVFDGEAETWTTHRAATVYAERLAEEWYGDGSNTWSRAVGHSEIAVGRTSEDGVDHPPAVLVRVEEAQSQPATGEATGHPMDGR